MLTQILCSVHLFLQNGLLSEEDAPTEKQLSQLNKTLNDFVIGNFTTSLQVQLKVGPEKFRPTVF